MNLAVDTIIEYQYQSIYNNAKGITKALLRIVAIEHDVTSDRPKYMCDGYDATGLKYEYIYFTLEGTYTVMPFSSWALAVMKGRYDSLEVS